ncbi:MAG: hypothetical protein HYT07_00155 [Candidatus Levybacteria bacterium]|nr:hypothetical protein [Candidatus Levybacteria bacterium]
MKKLLEIALSEVVDLNQTSERLINLFVSLKAQKVGYVAGIINSDGPSLVQRNRKLLNQYTRILKEDHKLPLFSAVDVFTDSVCKRLREYRLTISEREKKFYGFWDKVLSSGHVTDIFMTPRWEISRGARDEHRVAVKNGLKIHYVEDLIREKHSLLFSEQFQDRL